MRPAGIGRPRVRFIDRVDVGVVPHVERTSGAGADSDAEERDGAKHRGEPARRGSHADERREDHQRHDARLQERDVVLDVAPLSATSVRSLHFGSVQARSWHYASIVIGLTRQSIRNARGHSE